MATVVGSLNEQRNIFSFFTQTSLVPRRDYRSTQVGFLRRKNNPLTGVPLKQLQSFQEPRVSYSNTVTAGWRPHSRRRTSRKSATFDRSRDLPGESHDEDYQPEEAPKPVSPPAVGPTEAEVALAAVAAPEAPSTDVEEAEVEADESAGAFEEDLEASGEKSHLVTHMGDPSGGADVRSNSRPPWGGLAASSRQLAVGAGVVLAVSLAGFGAWRALAKKKDGSKLDSALEEEIRARKLKKAREQEEELARTSGIPLVASSLSPAKPLPQPQLEAAAKAKAKAGAGAGAGADASASGKTAKVTASSSNGGDGAGELTGGAGGSPGSAGGAVVERERGKGGLRAEPTSVSLAMAAPVPAPGKAEEAAGAVLSALGEEVRRGSQESQQRERAATGVEERARAAEEQARAAELEEADRKRAEFQEKVKRIQEMAAEVRRVEEEQVRESVQRELEEAEEELGMRQVAPSAAAAAAAAAAHQEGAIEQQGTAEEDGEQQEVAEEDGGHGGQEGRQAEEQQQEQRGEVEAEIDNSSPKGEDEGEERVREIRGDGGALPEGKAAASSRAKEGDEDTTEVNEPTVDSADASSAGEGLRTLESAVRRTGEHRVNGTVNGAASRSLEEPSPPAGGVVGIPTAPRGMSMIEGASTGGDLTELLRAGRGGAEPATGGEAASGGSEEKHERSFGGHVEAGSSGGPARGGGDLEQTGASKQLRTAVMEKPASAQGHEREQQEEDAEEQKQAVAADEAGSLAAGGRTQVTSSSSSRPVRSRRREAGRVRKTRVDGKWVVVGDDESAAVHAVEEPQRRQQDRPGGSGGGGGAGDRRDEINGSSRWQNGRPGDGQDGREEDRARAEEEFERAQEEEEKEEEEEIDPLSPWLAFNDREKEVLALLMPKWEANEAAGRAPYAGMSEEELGVVAKLDKVYRAQDDLVRSVAEQTVENSNPFEKPITAESSMDDIRPRLKGPLADEVASFAGKKGRKGKKGRDRRGGGGMDTAKLERELNATREKVLEELLQMQGTIDNLEAGAGPGGAFSSPPPSLEALEEMMREIEELARDLSDEDEDDKRRGRARGGSAGRRGGRGPVEADRVIEEEDEDEEDDEDDEKEEEGQGADKWQHTRKWSEELQKMYDEEKDPRVRDFMKELGQDLPKWTTPEDLERLERLAEGRGSWEEVAQEAERTIERRLRERQESVGRDAFISQLQGLSRARLEQEDDWWQSKHFLVTLLVRWKTEEGSDATGLYSLFVGDPGDEDDEAARAAAQADPSMRHLIAFESRQEARNYIQILLQSRGGDNAMIITEQAYSPADLFNVASNAGYGLTVLREGTIRMFSGQPAEEVEAQIVAIGRDRHIRKNRPIIDIEDALKSMGDD
eukprot:jgi/Mesen1/904/ME000116S00053